MVSVVRAGPYVNRLFDFKSLYFFFLFVLSGVTFIECLDEMCFASFVEIWDLFLLHFKSNIMD